MRWRQLWRSKWPARMQPPCRSWPDWKVEYGTERRAAALGSAAARLLRAYSAQVEVFRRLRHGGQQLVRVEHVHINGGGQAIIGNVNSSAASPKSTPEEVVETRPTPDLVAKSSEDSSSSGCRFIGDGPEGGEASDHR